MKFKFLTKRKIILFIAGLLLFSFVLAKPVQAFSTPTRSFQSLFEQAVFHNQDEMNLQSFVFETFKSTVSSVVSLLVGCTSCSKEQREKNPGLITSLGGFIAGVYASPPASGTRYLAYLGNKLGIVKPAYAQTHGLGFKAMENLLPVWTTFRNISYVFFVLIFIFIGFAIMFRVKINPQTVVTIQSALPKIVLALILVTFSYAIVGLMIDLMYVLILLVHSIFRNIDIISFKNSPFSIPRIEIAGVVITNPSVGDYGISLDEFIKVTIDPIRRIFGLHDATAFYINTVITDIFFFSVVPTIALVLALQLGPLAWLIFIIVLIMLLITLIRLAWLLLKTYAMIVINLIFAPLQILVGTLPGSNAIGSWFKNLVANIMVLPAVVTMLFLSSYLILNGVLGFWGENLENLLKVILALVPGNQGEYDPGLLNILREFASPIPFWDYFSVLILPMIGLVILFMVPKVADIIKSFITQRPFEYGTAIGQAMGPVTAGGKAGFYYGAETGIQTLEGAATAAGRTTGWDVTTARTLRRILGLKK